MERTLRPRYPLDLVLTLAPLRRGLGDPTMRLEPGAAWRATHTPEGPATILITQRDGELTVCGWGVGATWALEAAPDLLGFRDDPGIFRPRHPLIRELHRRLPGLRLGRSRAVVEALVPTVLEQKVVGKEARRSYRRLVAAHGEPAPGPGELLLPPHPELLARLPSYDLHPLGIERRRAETLRRACRLAARLEEAVAMTPGEAQRRLTAVAGIGPWSAAEVIGLALGDPDAVSPGDYHLPHLVSWALAGEPKGDDDRMLELLEPYRGQRRRVIRLLEAAGLAPPRRGPRRPLRNLGRI